MNERMFKEDFALYAHEVCMQNPTKTKVEKKRC